jgi:cell division protein ZapA
VKSETTPVTVHILDKEYRILCQDGEQNDLLASARYVDSKMRDIRVTGKVIGTDRIAVMAALNIAHELLQQNQTKAQAGENVAKRLRGLQEKIEIALKTGNRLEV